MIVFSRRFSVDQGRNSAQSLTRYAPLFGLNGSLHRDNGGLLREWTLEPRGDSDKDQEQRSKRENAIADLVAAVVLNHFKVEVLKRAEYARQLLRLSRDLLSDRGYVEGSKDQLIRSAGSDHNLNLMLVAGCQNEDILQNRVDAAFEICEELINNRRGVEIVFSGSHPGKTANIPDESRRMSSMFDELLEKYGANLDAKKFMHIELSTEEKATRTKENVKNFMQLKRAQLAGACNIIVVSSTFHVARVCSEVESELQLAAKSGSPHSVQNIIAVGSEPLSGNRITSLPAYIKAMCFECVRDLLFCHDGFWPGA